MEWYYAVVAIIGFFLLFVFLGIPINFALALSFVPILFFLSGEPPNYVIDLFGLIVYRKLHSFPLVAVPLFVLMGQLFHVARMGERLYIGLERWLNWVPGGLAVATIATTTVFAAVCGSSLVSAGTIGPISIPSMVDRGYNRKLALGSLCAGGTLAMLIPPSIPMIFYCVVTEQSIGRLFMAGLLPGIIISIMMITFTILRVKRNPSLAPRVKAASWGERGQAIPWLAGPIGLILLIFVTLYMGLASVNELASIGVLGAIALGLAYRQLNWRRMSGALLQTTRFLGFFGILFACAVFMGFGLTYYGINAQLSQWITGLEVPRVVVIVILMGLYLLLGMIMDASAIILVTMPAVLPIILALGYDPIWFGIMLILNLEVGAVTPPMGVNLFALKLAVPGVDLRDAIFGSLPYLGLILICMVLLVLFPDIALWLPNTMVGR